MISRIAAEPNRAAQNGFGLIPAPAIASIIALTPICAPFSAIAGQMISSPRALCPYSGLPLTFSGTALPLIGDNSPFIIASLIARTAGKAEILLFNFEVGIALTPERSTPASIRQVAPSFLFPAGIPTCAALPARYIITATINAAFAPSAPESFAVLIAFLRIVSTGR